MDGLCRAESGTTPVGAPISEKPGDQQPGNQRSMEKIRVESVVEEAEEEQECLEEQGQGQPQIEEGWQV